MPNAKPQPIELRKAVRSDVAIAEYRNLYCAHYSGCIDVAIRSDWNSFSCTQCAFFRQGGEAPHVSSFAYSQPGDPGR